MRTVKQIQADLEPLEIEFSKIWARGQLLQDKINQLRDELEQAERMGK